jgi:hypothetical protein
MAWNLQGTFFENCSCDAICPCTWSNLAHRATRDYCRFAMAFQVDSGNVDGVDLSGRSFVMIGDTPPRMDEGGWRLGVVVDEFLGIEQAPIAIDTDGKRHHVTVGDPVDYSGERITLEDGAPITLTNIVVHPAGPELGLAPVATARVSAFGISYDGTDLSGFANSFRWSA